MKVAILGYDTEGKVSYEYFKAQGHDVTICDQKTDIEIPEGADSVLGPDYLKDLDRFDVLVRTPGLKPSLILENNPTVADKITSGTNEFFKASPTKNIIGVTGTKGKGTTSTLITKILEAAGNKVFLGGNIGVPALSFIQEVTVDDWVVLELSSFQLIDCKYSPNAAVCLMVVPEHLNWHADMAEYLDAKRQLFAHQTPEDLAIYNACSENSIEIVRSSPGVKGWYQTKPINHLVGLSQEPERGVRVENGHIVAANEEICSVDELALLGEHNWDNVCAAIAATWEIIGHDREAVRQVVTTFSGLEHRLELVRTLNGVAYYDDSFGTTPETAMVAIEAFEEPKIVILGGSDKGTSFDELARTVKSHHVKFAILIGETAPAIEKALIGAGYATIVHGGDNMTDIVATAKSFAESGDVVLLSTGCASFDLFKDYKDRAAQFQQAVNSLAQ
ncbi:MAG: UDP-N-acetylmuramoylalanine--D-glutamate ligase [Candidatus Saccharibacteria bacterium]|nr:UDP-N-acetylmuramoylalanine--D-glutamate ligase [Candidatus Saccharibacteria bacterium]